MQWALWYGPQRNCQRHKILPTCNCVQCKSTIFFSSQQVMFGNLQSSVSWHDSTNEVMSLRQNFKVPIRIAFFLCTVNGKWRTANGKWRIHQHRHESWAAFTCICLGWNWYVWWCFVFSRTSATSTQNNWVIGTSFSLVRCISSNTVDCDLTKLIRVNASLDYKPTKYRHIMTIKQWH